MRIYPRLCATHDDFHAFFRVLLCANVQNFAILSICFQKSLVKVSPKATQG